MESKRVNYEKLPIFLATNRFKLTYCQFAILSYFFRLNNV